MATQLSVTSWCFLSQRHVKSRVPDANPSHHAVSVAMSFSPWWSVSKLLQNVTTFLGKLLPDRHLSKARIKVAKKKSIPCLRKNIAQRFVKWMQDDRNKIRKRKNYKGCWQNRKKCEWKNTVLDNKISFNYNKTHEWDCRKKINSRYRFSLRHSEWI